MRSISLFVEDYGHETIVKAIVRRIAGEFGIEVELCPILTSGGFGAVESELKEFVRSLEAFAERLPDLIIVATDANCTGGVERKKRLAKIARSSIDRVVFAIPDPHIERWLLLDPGAFAQVLGDACELPGYKCDRGRYKNLLAQAVYDAGQVPLLGGMEHAEDIVMSIQFGFRRPNNELEEFVSELRSCFRRWSEQCDS